MDGTTLVFRAVEGSTGFGGIFSTAMGAAQAGGTLSRIVDVTTPLPGFGGAVPYFGNFLFAADAGNVVFYARDSASSKSALFLAAGGTGIKRIAGAGDLVNGAALAGVDAPGAAAVQGSSVVFTGTRTGARGLYLAEAAPAVFSLQSVANSASTVAGPVSAGEIVMVRGTGMGPGARVLFDGIPATILYASSAQMNAIVPYAVDGRPTVQVIVDYNGATTPPLTLQVAGSAPGLYSADGSGSGPGAILNQDLSLNSASNPAAQGAIVILFGTGEGQTTPSGVDGQPRHIGSSRASPASEP